MCFYALLFSRLPIFKFWFHRTIVVLKTITLVLTKENTNVILAAWIGK